MLESQLSLVRPMCIHVDVAIGALGAVIHIQEQAELINMTQIQSSQAVKLVRDSVGRLTFSDSFSDTGRQRDWLTASSTASHS